MGSMPRPRTANRSSAVSRLNATCGMPKPRMEPTAGIARSITMACTEACGTR